MDADRFDTLTRALTAAGSRRRALTAALGGALSLLGLAHPDEAAAGGACKPACNECQSCKKGDCEKTKNGKKCKKGKCQAKDNQTGCSVGTCQSGSCVAAAPLSPPPVQCLNATETCANTSECCDNQLGKTECRATNKADCAVGLPGLRCCKFVQQPCVSKCECCADMVCNMNSCQAPPP
jgi:hypothetical protein